LDRHKDRQTDRGTDRRADRQTVRETDRRTDRQADRQTGGQTDKVERFFLFQLVWAEWSPRSLTPDKMNFFYPRVSFIKLFFFLINALDDVANRLACLSRESNFKQV
jgi:hypothetical protein